MVIIIAIVMIILGFIFVPVRIALLHPVKTVSYAVTDAYYYFKYNKKDYYEAGKLACYFAHFGGGKTLSGVEYIRTLYKRYNNKKIWDRKRRMFVTQKIHILSNVEIKDVACEELHSLSQFVNYAFHIKHIDELEGTRTCVIGFLDEASSQLNSRNFKTNINADFLNTLITCRHFNMSLFYTSQKFKLTDALLRSVTQTCIQCHKVWRFVITNYYDADSLELAGDATLIQPFMRTGYFADDELFDSYDTFATVGELQKTFDSDDYMSEQEILALRGTLNTDVDSVINPSRKLKRMRKRK